MANVQIMVRKEFDKIILSALLFHEKDISNKPLLENRLRWFWHGLKKYTYADISRAINAHNQVPDKGRFMPGVADIVAQIEQARQARRWDAGRAIPAQRESHRRGANVLVHERLMTLSEFLALPEYEMRALGQTPESAMRFETWLDGLSKEAAEMVGGVI